MDAERKDIGHSIEQSHPENPSGIYQEIPGHIMKLKACVRRRSGYPNRLVAVNWCMKAASSSPTIGRSANRIAESNIHITTWQKRGRVL